MPKHETGIQWTHRPGTKGVSHNFIAGCTKVSPGCAHCYALRDSWRIFNNPSHPERYNGVVEKVNGVVRWTGRVNVDMEALRKPQNWRTPRTAFVCSMADIMHDNVQVEVIHQALDVVKDSPDHFFLMLSKRAERLRGIMNRPRTMLNGRPIPNLAVGVSAEDNDWLKARAPQLIRTSAALRYLSLEPLLGPMPDLWEYLQMHRCAHCGNECFHDERSWDRKHNKVCPLCRSPDCADDEPLLIDQVLIGCESGPNRRFFPMEALEAIIATCDKAGTKVFVKQIRVPGGKVSHDPIDWHIKYRRQEFPVWTPGIS